MRDPASSTHREKWQPIYVDIICRRHYVDILCQKNRNVHPLFFDTFRHMSAKYVEKCRENLDIMSTLCRKIVSLWNYVDGIYVDKYVDICRHMSTYMSGQCPDICRHICRPMSWTYVVICRPAWPAQIIFSPSLIILVLLQFCWFETC